MNETEFEKQVGKMLRESAEHLDARTRSRLTQARYAALAELQRPKRLWLQRFAPAGAFAAAAVLAVLIWSTRTVDHSAAPAATPVLADMELLGDAETFDLLAESDPEFYEWAVAQDVLDSGVSG
ncbi:MAG: DUF3619 family protein [Steroidobacteraceae bacterium]